MNQLSNNMSDTQLDELIFVATSDIAARTKGRSLRLAEFTNDTSLGWVPANLGIGPLGHIVDDIPFGSHGDLRLLPDLKSRTRIDGIPGQPPLTLVFANLVETDGTPWPSCPRTFLRDAVKRLEGHGIQAKCAFEHEFVDLSAGGEHHPFSLHEFRKMEPLGSQLMTVLSRAGVKPETWLPEYGRHQFEVTYRPSDPVTAADRAVLVRDIVYALFAAHDRSVSFAPIVAPGGSGNGVHVHIGLSDLDANPLCYDADRPGRLSEFGAQFAAGIVKYAPEFTAMFAPLVTSYERLRPHNWSTARAFLGVQNREALIRVCPTNEINGKDPAPQLHFEFRGSDIGANPWLLLGLLLRAGLRGIEENLSPAMLVEGELDVEGKHAELPKLPESLEEALDRLSESETVREWLDPAFLATFAAVKHDEAVFLKGRPLAEQCEVYTHVY